MKLAEMIGRIDGICGKSRLAQGEAEISKTFPSKMLQKRKTVSRKSRPKTRKNHGKCHGSPRYYRKQR
jgi:hypothetical protein